MPKLPEGRFELGLLIAFATWTFVALPFLYGPPPRFADYPFNWTIVFGATLASLIAVFAISIDLYNDKDSHNNLFCWAARSLRIEFPHYLTAALTLFLAIFAYNAWDESKNSTKALNDQVITLQDGQRPWVGAPVIKYSTTLDGNASFIQTFKNVGHTPTKTLYIDGTISEISQSDIQQMCKRTDKILEEKKQPLSLIPGSDWELDVNKMPWQQDKPFNIKTVEAMKSPAIIGCVSYHSPFDQTAHHTGYVAAIKAAPGREPTVEFIYAAYAN